MYRHIIDVIDIPWCDQWLWPWLNGIWIVLWC